MIRRGGATYFYLQTEKQKLSSMLISYLKTHLLLSPLSSLREREEIFGQGLWTHTLHLAFFLTPLSAVFHTPHTVLWTVG